MIFLNREIKKISIQTQSEELKKCFECMSLYFSACSMNRIVVGIIIERLFISVLDNTIF